MNDVAELLASIIYSEPIRASLLCTMLKRAFLLETPTQLREDFVVHMSVKLESSREAHFVASCISAHLLKDFEGHYFRPKIRRTTEWRGAYDLNGEMYDLFVENMLQLDTPSRDAYVKDMQKHSQEYLDKMVAEKSGMKAPPALTGELDPPFRVELGVQDEGAAHAVLEEQIPNSEMLICHQCCAVTDFRDPASCVHQWHLSLIHI